MLQALSCRHHWQHKLPTFRNLRPHLRKRQWRISPPQPSYDWGGIYVGINGGWGWGNGKWTANTAVGNFSANANDNGGIIGGTLGFNYQMNAFVFGVEGDWDWSGMNTGTTSNVCTFSGTCQTGNNWLSTLRGRFGFAVDRVLFYGTAGGAFANVQTTFKAAPIPPIRKPGGPPELASKPLLPLIGRLRSNTCTSILAPEA